MERTFTKSPPGTPKTHFVEDWRLGKRIAEALHLRKSPSGSYKTEWGPKNEIGLARALRLILKP